jgi:hypothetical protein
VRNYVVIRDQDRFIHGVPGPGSNSFSDWRCELILHDMRSYQCHNWLFALPFAVWPFMHVAYNQLILASHWPVYFKGEG